MSTTEAPTGAIPKSAELNIDIGDATPSLSQSELLANTFADVAPSAALDMAAAIPPAPVTGGEGVTNMMSFNGAEVTPPSATLLTGSEGGSPPVEPPVASSAVDTESPSAQAGPDVAPTEPTTVDTETPVAVAEVDTPEAAAPVVPAAELTPQQQRVKELDDKRKAGDLKDTKEILELKQLKTEIGRDDRIAALMEQQKTGDGLSPAETDELVGLIDSREKAGAAPIAELTPAQKEAELKKSAADVTADIEKNGLTPENLKELNRIRGESARVFAEATAKKAVEMFVKSVAKGMFKEGSSSKETGDTQKMINEFMGMLNNTEAVRQQCTELITLLDTAIEDVGKAKTEFEAAAKETGDDVASKEKRMNAGLALANAYTRVNYYNGAIVDVVQRYDDSKIESRMSDQIKMIEIRMGLVTGFKAFITMAGLGFKLMINDFRNKYEVSTRGVKPFVDQARKAANLPAEEA